MAQPVDVDFPVNGFIFKTSGLSQNGSVFRYHIMAVKYQILRGLPFACAGIHITADQPGAGGLHQISPVAVLPYRFIGSGKIDRIDTCETEDQVYVKILDYKTGAKSFDMAAFYHGLQMQLVVYMEEAVRLEERKHPGKKIVPAGIFYFRMKDPIVGKELDEE